MSQPLGSLFDYGSSSLLGQIVHYNNLHPGQARGMVQFANALDIGATIYVGGTLGPAGIWGGGMIFVQSPNVGYGIGSALYTKATYVTAYAYAGVVVPTSAMTVNNPEIHELLEELIEEPWKWP